MYTGSVSRYRASKLPRWAKKIQENPGLGLVKVWLPAELFIRCCSIFSDLFTHPEFSPGSEGIGESYLRILFSSSRRWIKKNLIEKKLFFRDKKVVRKKKLKQNLEKNLRKIEIFDFSKNQDFRFSNFQNFQNVRCFFWNFWFFWNFKIFKMKNLQD